MARYFFDVSNGETVMDDDGIEFTDVRCASRAALQALPDMAKDLQPSSEPEVVIVTMRDEHGAALYRATLTIRDEWLQDKQ